jgi:hypothetical protein
LHKRIDLNQKTFRPIDSLLRSHARLLTL